MALSIKDPETDRVARELAEATGDSITEAIRRALMTSRRRMSSRLRGERLQYCDPKPVHVPHEFRSTPYGVISGR